MHILKDFLCIFDKNYNKNLMISYKDNMEVFILAKVMEMNEKEIFLYLKYYITFMLAQKIKTKEFDILCKISYN